MARSFAVALSAVCVWLAACSPPRQEKKEPAPGASTARQEHAPDVFHVQLDTSKGPVDVEVHRDWAPIGADHLYDLVKTGFYDGDRFYRVVRHFVVQFGINGDPHTNQLWATAMLPDDPVKQHNVRGTVTFATAGPSSRTTQLFINLADNHGRLDGRGFAPVGKVVAGMDVIDSLYSFYGDMPPTGQGPDPTQIQQFGNEYLESHFPRLDYIKKAIVR